MDIGGKVWKRTNNHSIFGEFFVEAFRGSAFNVEVEGVGWYRKSQEE